MAGLPMTEELKEKAEEAEEEEEEEEEGRDKELVEEYVRSVFDMCDADSDGVISDDDLRQNALVSAPAPFL